MRTPISMQELRENSPKIRNANERHEECLSILDRMALWITNHIGSMGFFLILLIWTILWMSWNILAPKGLRFDPPFTFGVWLFISNMIQIFLMPLIMIGQNLQARYAEIRAENDHLVVLKAEQEVEAVIDHLEYQDGLLRSIALKLGIRLENRK